MEHGVGGDVLRPATVGAQRVPPSRRGTVRAPRGRRPLARFLGAALVVVGVVMPVLVVGAGPASAETTITAHAGAAGWYEPGQRVPVVVTVAADRLIDGTIRVSTGSGPQSGMAQAAATVEVPVEVAGGSTKEVVVVVPSSSALNGPDANAVFSAAVELRQNDAVVADTEANATWTKWVEPVGVLPKFADLGKLPETTPLPLSGGTAKLVAIPAAALEAGPAALEVYPSIVALPTDLRELSPSARASLRSWIGDGGHLLVDGDAGAIEGLPDEWQPKSGWARAGAGEIRTTGGAAQAGRWDQVLVVTPAGRAPANPNNANGQFGFGTSMVGALGRDAGFQLPQLGVLLGLLVAYVLLAGPITFIALAKVRRRTLAWLIVPALAALFTGIFAVGGARLRESTDSAHSTVIDVAPGGAHASTTVLVGSINGGRTELQFPGGWVPEATAPQFNGFNRSSVDAPVPPIVVASGSSRAELSLSPGEFDLVRASGPVSGYDDALVVDATADGTDLKGTVTNNLDVALDEVTVFINAQAANVGRIDAHAHKPFSITSALTVGQTNGVGGIVGTNTQPEVRTWPFAPADMSSGGMGMGMTMPAFCDGPGCSQGGAQKTDDDTAVNLAQWTTFASENEGRIRRTTSVTAAGWTKELAAPLSVDGEHSVSRGRTAIVAHGTVRTSGLASVGMGMEMLRDTDLRRDELRKDERKDPIEDVFNGPTFRFTLPADAAGAPIDPTAIYLAAPIDLHRIGVYSADGWKVSPESRDGKIVVRLAPEDVIAGTVTVRVGAGDHFNQSQQSSAGLYAGWAITVDAPDHEPLPLTILEPAPSASAATGGA